MSKKLLALALSCMMLAGMLAGCGSAQMTAETPKALQETPPAAAKILH